MAQVAQRHHHQQHQVADESEPEHRVAERLHAERGGGGGRHDDAHIADEVGGEHLVQLELRDEAGGEPHDEDRVGCHGVAPQHESGQVRERRQVRRDLHEGHEQGGAHAGKDGIAHVLANVQREQDNLCQQQDDQEKRAHAARHMQRLGMGLQQVAERRQPERDSRGGDGYFPDEVAHGFSLSRLRCKVKFSHDPSKVKTYDLL